MMKINETDLNIVRQLCQREEDNAPAEATLAVYYPSLGQWFYARSDDEEIANIQDGRGPIPTSTQPLVWCKPLLHLIINVLLVRHGYRISI